MKLSDVMALYPTPDPSFAGVVTNDDNVLAVDITDERNAEIGDYVVVQNAIEGVDAQLNAITSDKQYIRSGMSTTKTGMQRTFTATGDRYIGDEFQDYAFSTIYKVGQAVVVPYVWFNKLNGKGEKGTCAIITNSDGSGNAGETAAVSIDLRKTGSAPVEFAYVPTGAILPLALTSVAGSTTGTTSITVMPAPPSGMTALYQTAATVSMPTLDSILTTGWSAFVPGEDYSAVDGEEFAVAYVDGENKAKYAGKATVVAAE